MGTEQGKEGPAQGAEQPEFKMPAPRRPPPRFSEPAAAGSAAREQGSEPAAAGSATEPSDGADQAHGARRPLAAAPPPKFAAPPPREPGRDAAKAAAVAAARAAQHATPAQRERIIMEAAANVSEGGWSSVCQCTRAAGSCRSTACMLGLLLCIPPCR